MYQAQNFSNEAPIGSQLIAILRDQIVTGHFLPGHRLSEQEIASGYGSSRQPVREAFIKLAAEQLVEIRPQRGTFVRKINEAEVMVSRVVRAAVEADMVWRAAKYADAAQIALLWDEIHEQEHLKKNDGRTFMQLDERFHQRLCDAAGQSGAWNYLQPVKMHMDRVRHLTAVESPPDKLVLQHRKIVEAIERHDPDLAAETLRQHLRGVLRDLPDLKNRKPDYFS
jgi:DNA-binding GntR family transcriptional regulator